MNYVDPTGHYVESAWDMMSFVMSLDECGAAPGWITCGAAVVDAVALAVPFIPGGAGAAVKATKLGAKVLSAADKVTDSAKLAKNLIVKLGLKAGDAAGYAAHHIVPGGRPKGAAGKSAELVREMLFKLGVGINDAANGVFLRHNGFHTMRMHSKEYVDWVGRRLSKASNAADAESILAKIGEQLQAWDDMYNAAEDAATKNWIMQEFFDSLN